MRASTPLEVVILAAGEGKRMRSALPKVLHPLAGLPLLAHVLAAARALGPDRIHVVVGHGAAAVRDAFADAPDVVWVEQREQLGTGHAVLQAMPGIADAARVLILNGDVPLVDATLLRRVLDAAPARELALVTARPADPTGLGRIKRAGDGRVTGVVEQKDATPAERAIDEINTGIYLADAAFLRTSLADLGNDNAQNEYYLTDIVAVAARQGLGVVTVAAGVGEHLAGINDRRQLAAAERALQRRYADVLLDSGVTLMDPARLDIRGEVTVAEDCVIDVGVVLLGRVRLAAGARIGAHSVIREADVGAGTVIEPQSVIDGAVIGKDCRIGPFARIRPGTELGDEVHIGNFVETKKTRMGRGSKANHLAYIGDVTMGGGCNVGAGTINCNYDGINKFTTHLGDGVFVGSNATLVAPISIADGSFVAAGSTVTTDVGSRQLAVGRARQRNIDGWTRPDARDNEQKKD